MWKGIIYMGSIFIKRILVNPKLGKCDVAFRDGVNILWAENVLTADKGADFRNSVGKTTFVHLIDYLLGKKQYISNAFAADGFFFERYMIAEVRLDEKWFTISRKLTDGDENRIYIGCVIDALLNNKKLENELLNKEGYLKFLTEQIYGERIIIGQKNYISHRSIMSYLIRDQFYGFSKFDSGIKEEQAAVRKKRLDFLLGLITVEKVGLEEEIADLNKEKAKLTAEKRTLKNYFDYISNETYAKLKRRKRELQKKLEKNQIALDGAEEIKNQIDDEIENNIKESSVILIQIKDHEEELYVLNHRVVEYQKAVNDIENEDSKINTMSLAYAIFQKIDFEKCPFYMDNLKEKNRVCDYLQNQGNGNQLSQVVKARKKLLQMEKKELIDSIKRVQSVAKQLKKSIKQLNMSLVDNQKRQEELYSERREKYEQIEEENQTIRHSLELIAKDTRNFEYLERLEDKIQEKKEQIKGKKELLNALQHNRVIELNEYYAKVINYITNNERVGEINYQTYEPRILYKNGTVDYGAGMKNASVVAFDIAIMELAINNQKVSKYYPLFLVHDSPKLHDLDLTIYYRLLDYMLEMEEQCKGTKFQYIITTLDISDNVLKDVEKYVRLKLDNSGDGGKLFGCTVDIV